MTTVAPNPYSPYATADLRLRHLFPSFFGPPTPGTLVWTGCDRLAVVPDAPPTEIFPGHSLPEGFCPACVEAMNSEGDDQRPLPSGQCADCGSGTVFDSLCGFCRMELHEEWASARLACTRCSWTGSPPELFYDLDKPSPRLGTCPQCRTAEHLVPEALW
jgi:hypothetical protein